MMCLLYGDGCFKSVKPSFAQWRFSVTRVATLEAAEDVQGAGLLEQRRTTTSSGEMMLHIHFNIKSGASAVLKPQKFKKQVPE